MSRRCEVRSDTQQNTGQSIIQIKGDQKALPPEDGKQEIEGDLP
jgi:hypothetical protein